MTSSIDPRRSTLVDRLRRLLPGLWLGVLLCVALIATPAAFATLVVADAGRVAGRILAQEAWLSLGLALGLLAIERRKARAASYAGRGSVLSREMLLLLGTVFCTVAGYFGTQPLMADARAGVGALSFGQLHLASTAFFAVKVVLVAALAWIGVDLKPAGDSS